MLHGHPLREHHPDARLMVHRDYCDERLHSAYLRSRLARSDVEKKSQQLISLSDNGRLDALTVLHEYQNGE